MVPRKRSAMDFHGVGSEGETSNILKAIDLDSFHVELTVIEPRSAENVKRFVRNRILFRVGALAVIHSDHVHELISGAMTQLANTFGYVYTSTRGDCAMGILIIESFWSYFNICITCRNLTDKQY